MPRIDGVDYLFIIDIVHCVCEGTLCKTRLLHDSFAKWCQKVKSLPHVPAWNSEL